MAPPRSLRSLALLLAFATILSSSSAMLINRCPAESPFVGCEADPCDGVRCLDGFMCETNACGKCTAQCVPAKPEAVPEEEGVAVVGNPKIMFYSSLPVAVAAGAGPEDGGAEPLPVLLSKGADSSADDAVVPIAMPMNAYPGAHGAIFGPDGSVVVPNNMAGGLKPVAMEAPGGATRGEPDCITCRGGGGAPAAGDGRVYKGTTAVPVAVPLKGATAPAPKTNATAKPATATANGCAAGVRLVQCLVDPCSTTKCAAGTVCKSSYCGSCSAKCVVPQKPVTPSKSPVPLPSPKASPKVSPKVSPPVTKPVPTSLPPLKGLPTTLPPLKGLPTTLPPLKGLPTTLPPLPALHKPTALPPLVFKPLPPVALPHLPPLALHKLPPLKVVGAPLPAFKLPKLLPPVQG